MNYNHQCPWSVDKRKKIHRLSEDRSLSICGTLKYIDSLICLTDDPVNCKLCLKILDKQKGKEVVK